MLQKLSGNVSPILPQTPPTVATVTTVTPTDSTRIEIPLTEFAESATDTHDQASVEAKQEAKQEANQVNFEKLSSRILTEISKVPSLRQATSIIIQVGDQTIEIPPDHLDKDRLMKDLQTHLTALQGSVDLSHVGQLQSDFSRLIVQIRSKENAPASAAAIAPEVSADTMAPATPAKVEATPATTKPEPLVMTDVSSPQLKSLEKEIASKIPAKTSEKYGINDEMLSKWKQTGVAPAALKQLLADYSKEHQDYFQPILLLVAYGKAVNEARAKVGLMPADQLKEAQKPFDEIKSAASKKWETLNAGAVKDTRKVAAQVYQEWQKADQQLTALQQATAGRTPSAAEQKKLDEAKAASDKLLAKQQKAQQVALDTAETMVKVRETRVELNGGSQAPQGMREKAAVAMIDAATTQVQAAKQTIGVQKRDPKVAENIPNNIYESLELLDSAEAMLPEWQSNQAVVSQREGVLEDQQSVLKPFMQAMPEQKRLETRRDHILQELKALPPESQSLPEHTAKRKKLQSELSKLTLAGDSQNADPAGGKVRPGEAWALKLNARSVGKLQATYQADLKLNNVPMATAAQKQRTEEIAGKSRDLLMTVSAQAQDAQDAGLDKGFLAEEAKQWQAFGKADAQGRIDAALRALEAVPQKPGPDRDAQVKLAQDEVAAAMQFMRNQEARFAKVQHTASGEMATLNAQLLADNLGIPAADLAAQSEQQAVKQHATVGSMHPPGDPAWLVMDSNFISQRAQLDSRTLERSHKHLDYLNLQDRGAERVNAQDLDKLRAINKALAALPPDKDAAPHEIDKRHRLEKEKAELKAKISNYESSPAGKWGVDIAHSHRQSIVLPVVQAEVNARFAEQKNNVEQIQASLRTESGFKAPKTPAELKLVQSAIQVTLAAAEMPSGDKPGAVAKYLQDVNAMVAGLPPVERQSAQQDVKTRALEIYRQYIAAPHHTAFGDTAALEKAVEEAINPGGQVVATDPIQKEWQQLRAQSDPAQAFAYHRQELEAALKLLETQVSGDIEAQFNLAVEKGGFTVGTAARIARSQMMDGDIDAAKQTLAAAVKKAIMESQIAEDQYKKLPPSKQEQYRSILRSDAPAAEKQEALEHVFGYRSDSTASPGANAEAETRAALALKIAGSSQTMIRANAAGSDYDYTANAQATSELLSDCTSGVKPQGGPEAQAIAARHADQRQRDEKYWNDPAIAILSTITDEALMFVVTMGASTAFSLAKGAVTGVSAVKNAYEASRLGKLLISGEKMWERYNLLGKGLAKVDGWLLTGGRLGKVGSLGLQFTRGMARNIAIEQSFKGLGTLAEQVGGKDTWLTWAAEASSKLFGTQVAEIKGLDTLQNSLWNIAEPMLNQTVLPLIYSDPKQLQEAQDVLHYMMMAVQTAHGMHQMHSQAKATGDLDAVGIHHDIEKMIGKELDPKIQETIRTEVLKYQEALIQNQGHVSPEHHQAFLKNIEATIYPDQPELRGKVREVLDIYLKPQQMQAAAQSSGLDQFDLKTTSPEKRQKTLETLTDALIAHQVTDSKVEARKIAEAQMSAMVLQQSLEQHLGKEIDWSNTSPENQAKLFKHLEQTAQQLQQMGLVPDAITALSVVKADLLQHMKDRVAQAQTLKETINLDALNQNFAKLDQHSQILGFSHALTQSIKIDTPKASEIQGQLQSGLQSLLQQDSSEPLMQRVQTMTSEILSKAGLDSDTISAHSKALALSTCQKWAELAIVKMQLSGQAPKATGLDWHDQHVSLLKNLGVESTQAQQTAMVYHLNQMVDELRTVLPADQTAAVKKALYEVMGQLQSDPNTDPARLSALQDHMIEQLKSVKMDPDKLEILSKLLIQESALLVKHLHQQAQAAKASELGNPETPPVVVAATPVVAPAAAPKAAPKTASGVTLPDAHQLKDRAFMMKFYQDLGSWDQIRQLKGQIPDEVFQQLHVIRDQEVQALWTEVTQAAKDLGLELHYPYVGRGPDKAGYTGAYADLDLVIRIKQATDPDGKPVKLSLAETAIKEMELKQLLQRRLGDLVPASGLMLDVNAYITPHFPEVLQGNQVVPKKLLEQNQQHELHMDFYQLRQGFGEHGHAQWESFQKQALATAQAADAKARSKGQPAMAEMQLREGFAWCERAYSKYLNDVADRVVQLKASPEKAGLSDAILQEQAAIFVRHVKENELLSFLHDNKDILEAPTLEGAQARVKYNQLQMELRAISPEAYAGNAAVQWGSRGGAEQRQFLGSLADNNYQGLQGRISQAQYILHYALDTSLPVEQRAWKAGKYDLRDAIFLDAVNAKGTMMQEVTNPAYTWLMAQKQKNPNFVAENEASITPTIMVPIHETTIIETRDNTANYVPVKENKAYNPLDPSTGEAQLPLLPDDDPRLEVENNDISKRKKVPVNKMDQAALDARVNAKSPEDALGIWVKYFGKEENTKAQNEALAREKMGEYLNMLAMTQQDTSALHLMRNQPVKSVITAEHLAKATPLKVSAAELRQRFIKEDWSPTEVPGYYQNPQGELLKVDITHPPQPSPAVQAHIDQQIAVWQQFIDQNPTADHSKAKVMIESFKALRDSDAMSIDLSHSTNSMMLDGLVKTNGQMLSAKSLKAENIVRKTGEGDTFSGVSGDKTDVFFGYGDEGLGTTMAYFRLAGETTHYNLALMPEADLKTQLKQAQDVLANFDKLDPEGVLFSPLINGGQDKAKVAARVRSLQDELTRRQSLPPELLQQGTPYPIMFSVDASQVSAKQLPNHPNGLVNEATVADRVDLKQSLRAVFVPADKIAETQSRLQTVFGPEHQIKVIAFEALDVAIQNPEMTAAGKTYDDTYEGMSAQQGNVEAWYRAAQREIQSQTPTQGDAN